LNIPDDVAVRMSLDQPYMGVRMSKSTMWCLKTVTFSSPFTIQIINGSLIHGSGNPGSQRHLEM